MFRWDTRKRAIMTDKKFQSLFNLRAIKGPPITSSEGNRVDQGFYRHTD